MVVVQLNLPQIGFCEDFRLEDFWPRCLGAQGLGLKEVSIRVMNVEKNPPVPTT